MFVSKIPYRLEIFSTWTFPDVTGFFNWRFALTWLTTKLCFCFYCPAHHLHPFSTFFRAFSYYPISPVAINLNLTFSSLKMIYCNGLIFYVKNKTWGYPVILPGHSWTLQLSVTDASPSHALPPLAEDTFSSLFLVIKPPPHVLEHSPTCHSSHSQWTN